MFDPFEFSGHKLLLENDEDDLLPFAHTLDEFISTRGSFTLNRIPWNPPTDIYETQDCIVLKMELSGVKGDDIDVTIHNNILTVYGCRYEEAPEKKKNYHLMEIHYGSFERNFRLPTRINKNNINATYKEGFLIITIPKKQTGDDVIDIES